MKFVRGLAAAFALQACFAHAQALHGRDLTGDGLADAYYDTAQNITWLADANYYLTQGGAVDTHPRINFPSPQPLPPGQIRFSTAVSWVDGLSVGAAEDWRLPQRFIPQGDPTGQNWNCSATACNPYFNWPTELSRLAGTLQGGAGPFANVMAGAYMVGGQDGDRYVSLSSPFSTRPGQLTDETSFVFGYAWAVHDGDVGTAVGGVAAGAGGVTAPVPEPGTYLLMMAGGVAILAARRRRATPRSQAA